MEYYKEGAFTAKICNEELKEGVNHKRLNLRKLSLVTMDRTSTYLV